MTTIAYTDGVVAYDSRECVGTSIVDDQCNKHRKVGDVHIFSAGRTADEELLIQAIQGNALSDYPESISIVAIVVIDGVVYTAGISKDEGYYFQTERQDNHFAIGSGSHHALTAMDLGCSAKEAVKYAMKRDTQTGGKIRTFKI